MPVPKVDDVHAQAYEAAGKIAGKWDFGLAFDHLSRDVQNDITRAICDAVYNERMRMGNALSKIAPVLGQIDAIIRDATGK